MRLVCLLLCALGVVLASTVAFAVSPAVRLPAGAVINLNTNVLIEPDGDHHQLSDAQVRQRLQQAAKARAGQADQSAGVHAKASVTVQEQSQ